MTKARNEQASPLRQARLDRNWTLTDAVAAIDKASPVRETGLTISLLSAWERNKVTTSLRYRQLCCDVYGLPPAVLFAHQDGTDPNAGVDVGPAIVTRLVRPYPALLAAMIDVVHNARSNLVITGSRTREAAYLDAIEKTLEERPDVVHHRVLYGPPRSPLLVDHMHRLLKVRDPAARVAGRKTLHLGIVDDTFSDPERFFVASEIEAVMVIPSLTGAEAFDTGIVLDADGAKGLIHHAREAYAGARRIETAAAVEALSQRAGANA